MDTATLNKATNLRQEIIDLGKFIDRMKSYLNAEMVSIELHEGRNRINVLKGFYRNKEKRAIILRGVAQIIAIDEGKLKMLRTQYENL